MIPLPLHRSTSIAFAIAAVGLCGSPLKAQVRAGQQIARPFPEQTASTLRGAGDTSIFAPVPWPAGNQYRGGDGAPGPKYWQQRADYDIRATLDTTSKTLTGVLAMRYTNNSPDTLRFIWMQLEQNAFREGALSYTVLQSRKDVSDQYVSGDVIDRITQSVSGKPVALTTHERGTMLKVLLAQPLAPGSSTTIDVAWHFTIPRSGAGRMGYEGSLFQIAQWYPRVAVYDDVRGWNTEQYITDGEFYLEYGDYKVELTVPAGYIVAATGTLDNPREVLTATQIDRLKRAATSEATVAIVTAAELASGAARPSRQGTLTWKFSAKNVRDVAWSASPQYQWDACAWHNIVAQSYYRPQAAPRWTDAADQARMSIQEYSERWFMYPYPQISAVEGFVGGMEYPMVAMESDAGSKDQLYNVLTHEVGHNWFPMIVGSNERTHYWQDEGLNQFMNTFSEARRYPSNGTVAQRTLRLRETVAQTQLRNVDIATEVPADRMPQRQIAVSQYFKPAAALHFLRDEVVDSTLFDEAFRNYIQQWAFKHPTPSDFFRTLQNATGTQLDWFVREWFLENPRFDQAVDTVSQSMAGDTAVVTVVYGNHGRGVLPILVRFTFSDQSTKDVRYPVEAWFLNTTRYSDTYRFPGKTVRRVELDPDRRLVDINRSNNVWSEKTP